jgi:photosystem II stability/assembly factor-like uncharacterized protein
VTGGPNGGRVFHSTDRGKTWAVQTTPLASGRKSAGVFGIAFRDATNGMMVGGDHEKASAVGPHAAVTADGGKTWQAADSLAFRSCVAWADGRWVAVGTSGSDASGDGRVWRWHQGGVWNSVAYKDGVEWMVGPDGRVAKWRTYFR